MSKKTTTRINAILKGINCVKSSLREGKINRAIEAALAAADEGRIEAEEKSLELLDKLKDTDNINAIINKWNEYRDDIKSWENTKEYILELKKTLSEQVSIEEE